jgi:hypothetical protein
MKKLIYITISIFMAIFFLAQGGCKKEVEEFTFKGQFINGTTMQPTRVNETMTLIAKNNNDKFSHEIGQFTTDSKGQFEFKYRRQKGSSITLEDGFTGRVRNLPINENFEKNPWYFSDKGNLELTLSTDNLLINNKDTLYFYQYYIDGTRILDTFTDISENHILNFRLEPGRYGFGYGRNSNEFYYDKSNKRLIRAKFLDVEITGDPVINIYEIKY